MKVSKHLNGSHVISSDGSIPPKSLFSYVLMVFPALFIFPWLRKLIFFMTLKNCHGSDFEPGFRFYYGDKIYADNVSFSDVLLIDYADVIIGSGTGFGKSCKIITAKHSFTNNKQIIAEPVRIGKNVQIATGVIILGNVTIGDNAVVGAGSVVTKNIPKNTFAAGNPAKIIKRF